MKTSDLTDELKQKWVTFAENWEVYPRTMFELLMKV